MATRDQFTKALTEGYSFKGNTIPLGAAMLDGAVVPGATIHIPLSTLNRHGLIAGATGTGKTKTLQRLAEALSESGVPVIAMDMKGDLSGISQAGTTNPKIEERHKSIGLPWKAGQFPVEFLSISTEKGLTLRATVTEFGPVLFSKILGLNDVQSGVVSLVFKYADDKQLPLLDLKDFKKTLQFLTNEGKEEIEGDYGRISTATSSTIIRKVLEIEQEGADRFFGERSFDIDDLLRVDDRGYGYISMIRLMDIQSKPRLFSTFMLSLLAEVYAKFPEEGDPEQPKLVMFVDEAHLIFREASKPLLEQLETTMKLIRSKGVGVIYCTQSPTDIPSSILAQLGLKVQHALRAFTAEDRKAIKQAAQNYPETSFYATDEVLTSMGIGEALVTALNEKGIPTPLAHTMVCAPQSRMGPVTDQELEQTARQSSIARKYNETIDPKSAYEMLSAKIAQAAEQSPSTSSSGRRVKTTTEIVLGNPITRQIGRTVARELTRGLLGALMGKGRKSFF